MVIFNQEQSDCAAVIADAWYQALADIGEITEPPESIQLGLRDLTRQIIVLSAAEQYQTETARAIGGKLAKLGYKRVDVIGKAPAILSTVLTQGLQPDQIIAVNTRLGDVLTQVIAGFMEQHHQDIIQEKDIALQTVKKRWKRAAEERREIERRNAAILQSLPDTLGIITLDGKIDYYHTGVERKFPQGLGSKFNHLGDILPGELVTELLAVYRQVVETRQPRVYEYAATFKQIGKRYFQDSISPYPGNCVLVINRDITQQKKIEEDLRASEARYRSVVEDQLELIARWRPDGCLTYVNNAVCTFLHQEYEQLIGSDFNLLLKPVDETEKLKLYASIGAINPENPIAQGQTHVLVTPAGQRWLEWRTRGTYNQARQVIEYQTVAKDITDLKQMEAALRESEARYRSVVEIQTEFIGRFKPDGTISFVNQAAHSLFGISPEAMIGRSIYEFVPEAVERLAQGVPAYRDILNIANPSITDELSVLRTDGSVARLETVTQAIFNDQGETIEYQTTGREVTELKRMEAALRESEERYRSMVEEQIDLIIRYLPDGKITFGNEAVCRFFSVSRQDLLTRTVLDFILTEDKSRIAEGLENLSSIQQLPSYSPIHTNQARVVQANGDIRWLEWTTRAIFDLNNKPVEYQSVGRDVTELKRIETALRESEERYRSVVEVQTEIIARFLADSTLTFVNEAFCNYFSRSRQEILGKPALELVYPGDRDLIVQALQNLQANSAIGLSKPFQTRVIAANGEIRWLESITSAISRPDGTCVEFQVVGRDVTELKQVQETLKQQNELLRQLSEQLINIQEMERQRIARELHDSVLNELGAMMIAPVEIITPKTVRDNYVKLIEQLRGTINGLRSPMLNYGLYAALEDLFDNLMDTPQAVDKLTMEIPTSQVRFDSNVELHLFRIIQQACDNALQHAQARHIRIYGHIEDNRVNLTVEDDGIGFQLGTETDLVKVLAHKHFGLVSMFERGKLIGADVKIKSHPGAGTQVHVLWEGIG